MTDQTGIDWPTCNEDECQGIRLQTGAKCLAHADSQDLEAELKRLSQEGTIDARGVTISAGLLDRILGAAPSDEDWPGGRRLIKANFAGADFGDHALFAGATFGDHASFDGATFGDHASFDRATFHHFALFDGATFGHGASFEGATFDGPALFDGASFDGAALFLGATFGVGASFADATFGDDASFDGATFGDHALFAGASFGDHASFDGATFGDHAQFERVRFGGSVSFDDVKIGDWARLGPVVAKELTLRRAIFGRAPDLVISADRLRCLQAKFPDGGRLRVEEWSRVVDRPICLITRRPPAHR
jgi:uncharacterized protein YjbI with pentapeptide repeats